MMVHTIQGGKMQQVVYQYDKKHDLPIVYVALIRVTSLEGMFITIEENTKENFVFHHGRKTEIKHLGINVSEKKWKD